MTPEALAREIEAREKLLSLKREEVRLREHMAELGEGLPFLYGWKWYKWAREFYESVNKINLLCAANQISKSSTAIRKAISWATNKPLWNDLWGRPPVQFWYLYPTKKQVKAEFLTKWKQFLPRGKYKEEETIDGKPNLYAWKEMRDGGDIEGIHFYVADVYIFFKTYAQDVQSLQTGTCDAIFCDEELPVELFEELIFRISASNGYFHMVFTATLGQDQWRRAMEPLPHEQEFLPEGAKWTVSMYDCLLYEDGTPSHWTAEKIQTVIDRCHTQNEVLKRVHGKFIVDKETLKYPQFDLKKNVVPGHSLPRGWSIFSGVDIGSGGVSGHRSAICFVAVSPDFSKGRVFLGWRGDGVTTSAGDVVEKYIHMKNYDLHGRMVTQQFYDFASKDFYTIADRQGEGSFQTADKSHSTGEQVLNSLFKAGALLIYETPELHKLATELSTLRKDVAKNKCKDDFADALRYAVTKIPWAWDLIFPENQPKEMPAPELSEAERQIEERRSAFEDPQTEAEAALEEDFAEANDLYGT